MSKRIAMELSSELPSGIHGKPTYPPKLTDEEVWKVVRDTSPTFARDEALRVADIKSRGQKILDDKERQDIMRELGEGIHLESAKYPRSKKAKEDIELYEKLYKLSGLSKEEIDVLEKSTDSSEENSDKTVVVSEKEE